MPHRLKLTFSASDELRTVHISSGMPTTITPFASTTRQQDETSKFSSAGIVNQTNCANLGVLIDLAMTGRSASSGNVSFDEITPGDRPSAAILKRSAFSCREFKSADDRSFLHC